MKPFDLATSVSARQATLNEWVVTHTFKRWGTYWAYDGDRIHNLIYGLGSGMPVKKVSRATKIVRSAGAIKQEKYQIF